MRKSKSVTEEGYLGKYMEKFNLLYIGIHHSMVFSDDNKGLIYLNPFQRKNKDFNKETGKMKKVKCMLAELV